eukprot:CFRG1581T1
MFMLTSSRALLTRSTYRSFASAAGATTGSQIDYNQKVLQASLPLVPIHGWTTECLSQGALSIGLPSTAHGLVEDGDAGLVKYFLKSCSSKLAKALDDSTAHRHMSDDEKTERIKYAMRLRLKMTEPYASRWPEGLVVMKKSPTHVNELLTALHDDINEISYYSGVDSTNFDWYTTRTALSTVYTTTELFMSQDKSQDFAATYSFLDRRLEDLSTVKSATNEISNTMQMSVLTIGSIFQTAQNMAGFGGPR